MPLLMFNLPIALEAHTSLHGTREQVSEAKPSEWKFLNDARIYLIIFEDSSYKDMKYHNVEENKVLTMILQPTKYSLVVSQ